MVEKSVLIKEYTKISGKKLSSYPLVPVRITINGKEKEVVSLLDTGYDGKLIISFEQAEKIGLTEDYKIQDEAYPIQAANKEEIPTYLYKTKVRVGSIKGDLAFNVVDKSVSLLWDGILGREALDQYKIIFDEKSNPKQVSIRD